MRSFRYILISIHQENNDIRINWIITLATLVGVLSITLGACAITTPTQTPAIVPTTNIFNSEMGSLKGEISNLLNFWVRKQVYVFAAEYHGNQNGQGIYVLEPSIHPSTIVGDGGVFQLNNIPPGEYVLMVGPSPEEALVIRENRDILIVTVNGGEVTDVGSITLEW